MTDLEIEKELSGLSGRKYLLRLITLKFGNQRGFAEAVNHRFNRVRGWVRLAQFPDKYLKDFCEVLGISQEEFFIRGLKVCSTKRSKKLPMLAIMPSIDEGAKMDEDAIYRNVLKTAESIGLSLNPAEVGVCMMLVASLRSVKNREGLDLRTPAGRHRVIWVALQALNTDVDQSSGVVYGRTIIPFYPASLRPAVI